MKRSQYTSFLNTKAQYWVGFSLLLFTAAICAAFSFTGSDDFDLARQQILLRNIGHQVLLHAGDSTSKVLPVKKVTENEYQIQFENEFAFQTDTLVRIVNSAFKKEPLARNYIVNVLDCQGKDLIYGYAMFTDKRDSIVPCLKRNQPKSCYIIDIRFQNPHILSAKKGYLIGGIPLLAFIGLLVAQRVKKREMVKETNVNNEQFEIGRTIFYPLKRQLINNSLVIELTAKENNILLIFACSPNVTIERTRLQKEIWEDEGVIVGRSLDMFISKLRKKLEIDSTIKLANIHGKGYRLETV